MNLHADGWLEGAFFISGPDHWKAPVLGTPSFSAPVKGISVVNEGGGMTSECVHIIPRAMVKIKTMFMPKIFLMDKK